MRSTRGGVFTEARAAAGLRDGKGFEIIGIRTFQWDRIGWRYGAQTDLQTSLLLPDSPASIFLVTPVDIL